MGAELVVLIAVLLVGGVAQGLVIRADLWSWSAIPLDAGRSWRGRRIFGDNKTVRGVFVMVLATTVAAAVLLPLAPPVTPPPRYEWTGLGALMGVAYLLAELPNSFVKRRLDIAPGAQSRGASRSLQYVADQADSVIGVVIMLWLTIDLPANELVALAVLGFAIHAIFDLLLRRSGIKPDVTSPRPPDHS